MKVSIRPLQVSDAYVSYKWRNDKDVFKYTGNVYDNEITLETELDWIKKVISNVNEHRCAIEVDDVYVGNIYLTDIDRINKCAQYHVFIGNRDYWGKGVAKQASLLILNYAFENLQLENVYLDVHKNNDVALGLYRNIGFIEKKMRGFFITMNLTRNCYLCLAK